MTEIKLMWLTDHKGYREMKMHRFVIVGLLVLGLSLIAQAQTAEAVLQRAVDAMGGQAAFDSITSMSMTINGSMSSMEFNMKMWVVKPEKVRIDMNMMGMEIVQATDGTDYWMSQSGKVMDMPAAQKQSLDMNKSMMTGGGFNNLAALGITTDYVGRETANGVEAEVVSFNYQNETTGKWYFSAADNLPFLVKMDTPMGETEMRLSEYQVHGGMKMATHFEMDTPGGTMTMAIEDIQVNIPIDANIFARPQ
jgi:outer membrane lipoprotein-sorting protein